MGTLLVIGVFVVILVALIGGFITHWTHLSNEQDRRKALRDRSNEELTAENGRLHDRVEQLYDRIETLERIVTDKPSRLAEEIDKLDALPPRPAPLPRKDEK